MISLKNATIDQEYVVFGERLNPLFQELNEVQAA